jgi:hypothetical protein
VNSYFGMVLDARGGGLWRTARGGGVCGWPPGGGKVGPPGGGEGGGGVERKNAQILQIFLQKSQIFLKNSVFKQKLRKKCANFAIF